MGLAGPLRGEMRHPGPCSSLQFLVDCSNIQSLPTLTFIINGVQFPLPPTSYILNVSPGPCRLREWGHDREGGGWGMGVRAGRKGWVARNAGSPYLAPFPDALQH